MTVRAITPGDRETVLNSFKPLFEDWDYLPLVIDDGLHPSSRFETWLAFAGPGDSMLVAMAQVEEVAAGDFYLRGLRSNPHATPQQVAGAILILKRTIEHTLREKKVETVRHGTLDNNRQSLRLAGLFGFQEFFRLGHAWHPLGEAVPSGDMTDVEPAGNISELFELFGRSPGLKPVGGYFFTWWDTRRLKMEHLEDARKQVCCSRWSRRAGWPARRCSIMFSGINSSFSP